MRWSAGGGGGGGHEPPVVPLEEQVLNDKDDDDDKLARVDAVNWLALKRLLDFASIASS